ncbi:MAG: aldose epimerase family protein [Propionibacteriaceae bacterium]
MTPDEELLELSAGNRARVKTAGSTLAALTHRGHDLIVQFDPLRSTGVAYQGCTLAPWPNCVAGGAYGWAGRVLEVPVNEDAPRSALHGLACWQNWTPAERTGSSLRLALGFVASPGYPLELNLDATYSRDAVGLTVAVSATNEGDATAPFRASSHPFLTCGVLVDDCTLVVLADEVVVRDASLILPDVRSVTGTPWGLRRAEALGAYSMDKAYQDLPPGAGWAVMLPVGYRGVTLESDTARFQVDTGELLGRRGVAVEALTCHSDAFNQAPDTVRLARGPRTRLRFAIRPV